MEMNGDVPETSSSLVLTGSIAILLNVPGEYWESTILYRNVTALREEHYCLKVLSKELGALPRIRCKAGADGQSEPRRVWAKARPVFKERPEALECAPRRRAMTKVRHDEGAGHEKNPNLGQCGRELDQCINLH